MALALNDLATDVSHVGLVLLALVVYRLINVHRRLNVRALRIQPRHLNVLHLCLVNAGAFP